MANFQNLFTYIKNLLKRELVILWIFSLLAGLALVLLADKNKLPLGVGDFVFFAILTLLIALYRPRWIFFLFVSFVPLENIILTGGFLPIQLRPYQFLGGILLVAVLILYFVKKLKFKIRRPNWVDWFLFSLVPLSFLASLNSPYKNISLKNSLILLSFIALYYLARNFVRARTDLMKTVFFFGVSYLIVVGYGFYQVLADKFGKNSFEIMFGRTNSTFTEPDWLGIFLCFSLAVFLTLIFYFIRARSDLSISKKYILWFLDFLVFLDVTLIILTLSRSAWVGATAILVLYLLLILAGSRKDAARIIHSIDFRSFFREMLILALIVFLSLAAIRIGGLSKFDIFDRARSAATSEQKITVACEPNSQAPQFIADTSDLSKYNCRFINLEEIDFYRSQGKVVSQIFRRDPNVKTRNQIYRESFEIIRQNPLWGVGFGTITQKLGTDERGAGFNESNIFLQAWAGSGILGLLAFSIAMIYLFIYSLRRLSPLCLLNKIIGHPIIKGDFEKTINVFIFLEILAFMIPNLFNAGLFMGIFWLGLGIIVSAKSINS